LYKENKGKAYNVNRVLFINDTDFKYTCVCDGDIIFDKYFDINKAIMLLEEMEDVVGIVAPEQKEDRRHLLECYFRKEYTIKSNIKYLIPRNGFLGVAGGVFIFRTQELKNIDGYVHFDYIEPYQPDEYFICSKYYNELKKLTVIIPEIYVTHPFNLDNSNIKERYISILSSLKF